MAPWLTPLNVLLTVPLLLISNLPQPRDMLPIGDVSSYSKMRPLLWHVSEALWCFDNRHFSMWSSWAPFEGSPLFITLLLPQPRDILQNGDVSSYCKMRPLLWYVSEGLEWFHMWMVFSCPFPSLSICRSDAKRTVPCASLQPLRTVTLSQMITN